MDVILLQDVKNVGKKGDTVNLKDGYARNLVSKKQAVEASAKAINDLKLQKKHEEKVAEERLEDAQALAAKLTGLSVTISIKVGKDGRVFGSVSGKEIQEAVKQQLNIELDKKKLVLPDGIKELGVTEVPVKLHPQVSGSIKVKVVAE